MTLQHRLARSTPFAFTLIGLARGYLPAFTDRIDLVTVDGEPLRWFGVILFASGGALRLWPVFVLGNRFSGLVAIQSDHALVAAGSYLRLLELKQPLAPLMRKRTPEWIALLLQRFTQRVS